MTFPPTLINMEYDINWLANIKTTSSSNTSHWVMMYYFLLCGIGFCLQIFYLVILNWWVYFSTIFFLILILKIEFKLLFIILFFTVRPISYFQYLLKYIYCRYKNKLFNFFPFIFLSYFNCIISTLSQYITFVHEFSTFIPPSLQSYVYIYII